MSEFGIKGRPARSQNAIDPIFAPKEMQSQKYILWSLPYKLPFKVIDFLLVSSNNMKYYLVGSGTGFVKEFLNSTKEFNTEYVLQPEEIEAEGNIQVRVVDVDGTNVPGKGFPPGLQSLEDKKVTAVSFKPSNEVDYYQKEGSSWRKLNQDSIKIISLPGERDAAKFAAIFAGDDNMYRCNMNKAFKRLEILTEVYGGENIARHQPGGKLGRIISYYDNRPYLSGECPGYLKTYDNNALTSLASLKNTASACTLTLDQPGGSFASCVDLISAARNLAKANENLRLNCITLY